MNARTDLAERMELVGQVFEIDGMQELLTKYEKGISMVKFNAVTIQVTALLLKQNKDLADRIMVAGTGRTQEEVDELDDGSYAAVLKDVILRDVLGFFGSSPRADGQK